jgi:hypothetical protein
LFAGDEHKFTAHKYRIALFREMFGGLENLSYLCKRIINHSKSNDMKKIVLIVMACVLGLTA